MKTQTTPTFHGRLWDVALAALTVLPVLLACSQLEDPPSPLEVPAGEQDTAALILSWNEVALTANALDHTPVKPGENRVFGEQLGPGRTSRAFAIVHIAIFDAVNAITGGYESFTGVPAAPGDTSLDAAIAQAAHDTLAALYPSQAERFSALLAADLSRLPDGHAKEKGVSLGQQAAAAILVLRGDDGSIRKDPSMGGDYIPGCGPGDWRQDPISKAPIAMGAYWGEVKPFVLRGATQFRAPPPPLLESLDYAVAFNEVKQLGGDGLMTPTVRAPEQTYVGKYWAYDGTSGVGTPPRLYNQIAVHVARQMRSDAVALARLLALVNVAMADEGIACWESKYHYAFWRPVTGIREASGGKDLTCSSGDGNPLTEADPRFTPLGAPASNLDGPDFTPPFPAYPSGHACFGAALFQTLRRFYGTDDIAFTFVSDEYNGRTHDSDGQLRPLVPRTFSSLSEAEEENGQSRIYLGIHWRFDKTEGIAQGRSVADWVFEHTFLPPEGK
ncbi:MAG: phosphatase PAP2 family protein [Myxococcaceae bacterium]|nr:phosphatase PAP2 family protein [Myxococcaceae bacterium]MCI0669703.1 phosphatase PAP2 family protein [Myxococcaceae bacterium]